MNRLRPLLLIAVALYWALLLVATHLPPRELPKTPIDDKIEHFVSYGLLSVLLLTTATLSRSDPDRTDWLILAIVLAYGAFDELTQPPFGRTCDYHDWLADAAGAATALVLVGFTRWFLRRACPSKPASQARV
jgi:VanZ family protein